MITGEFGEYDCGTSYSQSYMEFADGLDISYLGWAWDAIDPARWLGLQGAGIDQKLQGETLSGGSRPSRPSQNPAQARSTSAGAVIDANGVRRPARRPIRREVDGRNRKIDELLIAATGFDPVGLESVEGRSALMSSSETLANASAT